MLPPHFWSRPISRWPLAVHACVAVVLLLAVWGVGYGVLKNARHELAKANSSLDTLQAQARQNSAAVVAKPMEVPPNFTHSLPSREAADAVVRDMGRHAQSLGLTLGALTVVHQASTARELGKVQLTLTANGEYAKAKAWLAELLARYPSLAVQTLSARAAAEATRQEWQLVLALYVKD
jgi:Tfp pilus assembly protein PilO